MNRCELENSAQPQEPALPPKDKADANIFLRDMLLCLPIIGVSFFHEESLDPLRPDSPDLFLHSAKLGLKAWARQTANNGILVCAGSDARKDEASSAGGFVTKARKALLENGTLEDAGDKYRFTRDYGFKTPSGALEVSYWVAQCNGLKEVERLIRDGR